MGTMCMVELNFSWALRIKKKMKKSSVEFRNLLRILVLCHGIYTYTLSGCLLLSASFFLFSLLGFGSTNVGPKILHL